MLSLLQSSFIEALGWSLVDSLWQTGALWGAYILITANGKLYSAAKRHNLALLSVSCGTFWFLISLMINYNNAVEHRHLFSLSYFLNREGIQGIGNYHTLDQVVSFLSILYLVAISVYASLLYFQHFITRNSFRNSFMEAPRVFVAAMNELREKIGVSRRVALWISEKAASPLTTGLWKPAILLPLAAVNNLSVSQIESVLAHELSHIKRNDFLLNIFLLVSEVVLFFNPFARLLAATVRKERENSCDDAVLSMGFDAWDYSQALYLLGNSQISNGKMVLAATGSGKKFLLARIKRLMKIVDPSPSVVKPLAAFFLCLVVAMTTTRNSNNVNVLPALPQANEVVLAKKVMSASAPSPAIIAEPSRRIQEPCRPASPPPATNSRLIEKPSEPEEAADQDEDEVIYNMPQFVEDARPVEYTIIIPEHQEVPQVITREYPAPYVPGATFYYPVDTLKVVPKVIVVI